MLGRHLLYTGPGYICVLCASERACPESECAAGSLHVDSFTALRPSVSIGLNQPFPKLIHKSEIHHAAPPPSTGSRRLAHARPTTPL